jgi:hypothetical protein
MGNELVFPQGFPVTLQFSITDLAQDGITDASMPGGNDGFRVPANYKFHPMMIMVHGNANATAESATAKVTDDGSELDNGPEATVNTSNKVHKTGVARPGVEPIAAGAIVGASMTATSGFTPNGSVDYDIVVSGMLLPA